ncbi:MAG: cytochrome bd ubiquinol oxidase, subunit [Actinobacteria bacterium]|nr:cytochrome bd ubiquinol oxidase, subunit [Actinomycetota bacterium]
MIETDLNSLWFLLIAVLWIGYFFLEGFDFGVGILMPFVGRDDPDRRVALRTIGPHWDGNEVWLIVAGGATFAAFPEWYATLFSGFYLPLFVILVALIVRGVALGRTGHAAAVHPARRHLPGAEGPGPGGRTGARGGAMAGAGCRRGGGRLPGLDPG